MIEYELVKRKDLRAGDRIWHDCLEWRIVAPPWRTPGPLYARSGNTHRNVSDLPKRVSRVRGKPSPEVIPPRLVIPARPSHLAALDEALAELEAWRGNSVAYANETVARAGRQSPDSRVGGTTARSAAAVTLLRTEERRVALEKAIAILRRVRRRYE